MGSASRSGLWPNCAASSRARRWWRGHCGCERAVPGNEFASRCARRGTEASASRNRLPARAALRYVGLSGIKSIPACPPTTNRDALQASHSTIGRRGRHQSLRPGVRYDSLASSPQSEETISDELIAGGRRCKGPVSRWDPLRRVGGRAIERRAAQTAT
jgi:hypothetical protein